MWMLNKLSSPYGNIGQKITAYFLQALFSRMTDSGESSYRSVASASDKTCSFESTRKTVFYIFLSFFFFFFFSFSFFLFHFSRYIL
jgi:membrane protein insertase Oxa1/YidC/SpoIIIJ